MRFFKDTTLDTTFDIILNFSRAPNLADTIWVGQHYISVFRTEQNQTCERCYLKHTTARHSKKKKNIYIYSICWH